MPKIPMVCKIYTYIAVNDLSEFDDIVSPIDMKTDLSENQELVRPVAEKISVPSEMEVLAPQNPPQQKFLGGQFQNSQIGGHTSSSGVIEMPNMEYHSLPPSNAEMSHNLNDSLTGTQSVPFQPGPGSSRHSLAESISGPTSPVTVQSGPNPVQSISPYEQDDVVDENTELPDSFHPKPTGFTIPTTNSDPKFDVSFEAVNSVGPPGKGQNILKQ